MSELINAQDGKVKGSTLLHLAAAKGCQDIVAFMVKEGVTPSIKNANGDTPLLYAVLQGKANVAEILISAGGRDELQCTTKTGRIFEDPALISSAAIRGDLKMVQLLRGTIQPLAIASP